MPLIQALPPRSTVDADKAAMHASLAPPLGHSMGCKPALRCPYRLAAAALTRAKNSLVMEFMFDAVLCWMHDFSA